MGELWRRADWNSMIPAVNDLSTNPPAGTMPLSPLDQVPQAHKWSSKDIDAVRSQLQAICNNSVFSAPLVKRSQACINEIRAAIARGWCGVWIDYWFRAVSPARRSGRLGARCGEPRSPGVTSPEVSDFANSYCASYGDGLRFRLRPALQNSASVAAPEYGGPRQTLLPCRGQSARDAATARRSGRRSSRSFTKMSLDDVGESPEADAWLAYAYKLWVNRFPLDSGDGGVWAERTAYRVARLERSWP
jgi:hypothetical protein